MPCPSGPGVTHHLGCACHEERRNAREAVLVEVLRELAEYVEQHRKHGHMPVPALRIKVTAALADPSPRADALLAVVEAARQAWEHLHKIGWPEDKAVYEKLSSALTRLDGEGGSK